MSVLSHSHPHTIMSPINIINLNIYNHVTLTSNKISNTNNTIHTHGINIIHVHTRCTNRWPLYVHSCIMFCCSGRIPRLSLNQHSLYVGVVEKSPPPQLTGEQYGKMEPKYPEGGPCQSVLRPQGVLTFPFILNNSCIMYLFKDISERARMRSNIQKPKQIYSYPQ